VITLIVDLLVAGLLLATLSYCIVLNRRLAALRDDKGELRDLIRGLAAASQRAEASVASLRLAAEQIGVGLQEEIDRARGLRDDLAYMLERGGSLADRLEGSIRQRRDDARAVAPPPSEAPRHPQGATARAEAKTARPRVEPSPPAVPRAPEDNARTATGRIANFASRAERDLRRVIEGRR